MTYLSIGGLTYKDFGSRHALRVRVGEDSKWEWREVTDTEYQIMLDALNQPIAHIGDECTTLPGCMMPDGADPCDAFKTLYKENERLRRDLSFVALWCYRSCRASDSERFKVIKFHPAVKAAAVTDGLLAPPANTGGE